MEYVSSLFRSWSDWLWSLFHTKRGNLLIVGLDFAGKTTLLHLLKDDKLSEHTPTLNPSSEEFCVGNVTIKAFDMGGHDRARTLWRDYFTDVDAILFMVDAVDRERIGTARDELFKLLGDAAIAHVPVAVLGNKIDRPDALSETWFRDCMSLTQTTGKARAPVESRPLETFMCSLHQRSGYGDAIQWLAYHM